VDQKVRMGTHVQYQEGMLHGEASYFSPWLTNNFGHMHRFTSFEPVALVIDFTYQVQIDEMTIGRSSITLIVLLLLIGVFIILALCS